MRIFPIIAGILLVWAICHAASAMESNGSGIVLVSSERFGPAVFHEMEAFLDAEIPGLLVGYHIPGATIAVVKDGNILFAKGYGYSDMENKTPVDADRTLFRIGSVSKLFTWTAVMQQAEAGKIDLDADINSYLADVKIPDTYPKRPVTMRHLMTHTAGFEEELHLFAGDPSKLEPYGVYLSRVKPQRVKPPGESAAYSNYGAVLAAYAVENVSGLPFGKYLEKKILVPLEMNMTTIVQPLPPAMSKDMASGYTYADGRYTSWPFELIRGAPAGAISSTAEDMARFMIAHLQNGHYRNARIISKETTADMHSPHFSRDERISPMGLGFSQMRLSNLTLLVHGGDTQYFHSLLALIPEENTGLFVSFNGDGGAYARDDILQRFLLHYYPAPAGKAGNFSGSSGNAARCAGTYQPVRRSYSSFRKFVMTAPQVVLKTAGNGSLLLADKSGDILLIETGPLVFSRTDADFLLSGDYVFIEKDKGMIQEYYLSNVPFDAYERVLWYETRVFSYFLLYFCCSVFLSVSVWPARFMISRFSKSGKEPVPERYSGARRATGIAATLNLVFFFVLMFLIIKLDLVRETLYSSSVPPVIIVLLAIPVVTSVLTVYAAVYSVLVWKYHLWDCADRVHYTAVAIALVAFVWWTYEWNLLGFRI